MLIIKVTTGFFFSFIFTATIEIVQKLRMEYMPEKKLIRCTNNMIQRIVYKHFTNGLLTCVKNSVNIQHILKSMYSRIKQVNITSHPFHNRKHGRFKMLCILEFLRAANEIG